MIMNKTEHLVTGSQDQHIQNQLVRTGSLVEHYRICHGIVNKPDIDAQLLAWLFVYVRLFATKDVRLNMNHNYQAKDISHIQDVFSMALAKAYVDTFSHNHTDSALERALIRNVVNFIPRGGGNGDEIRLFILDVMRRHGIREGHRPGIDDPFLEQWHQKLHSCSTPEDITICEAYVLFQETNSHDQFYDALWDWGGISVDFLRNMSQPLTHAPRYMPQLIPDLKHLLWILKQIHGGSGNLHYLIEVSKWQFDGELVSMLEDVKNNFGACWIPGKIIKCRKRLSPLLKAHCPRDPVMIDVALDNMYKTSIERIDLRTLSRDDMVELIFLTLQNIFFSYNHEKIALCCDLWERVRNTLPQAKWSRLWSSKAFAALSYVQLMIQSYTDELYNTIQPKAEVLGKSCSIDEAYITNFAEEVIRSQSAFSLSKLVDALFPTLRKAANIGPWKIVSQGTKVARGRLSVSESLLSVHKLEQDTPHIMIVDRIDGTEDIPSWVAAVLTTDDVDILSHIAIRCRNSEVILATCYDPNSLEKMKSRKGMPLSVFIENDTLRYEETEAMASRITSNRKKRRSRDMGGSKSRNLMALADKLSDHIRLPVCAVFEPDMFDETLRSAPESMSVLKKLESELASHRDDSSSVLARIRNAIDNLSIPDPIVEKIRKRLATQHIISEWSEALKNAICLNVKKVWASVWNERAYLSRISRGLSSNQIRMGVLIQKVIPADYAFIVHTCNPISDNPNEILTEVVVGLGETLAGNSAGAPLSVISKKGACTHLLLSPILLRLSRVSIPARMDR
jgi:alpha-glucan,water dikinase